MGLCCGKKGIVVDPYAAHGGTFPEPPPRSTTTGSFSSANTYSTLIPAPEPEPSFSDTQHSTQRTQSVCSTNGSTGRKAHLAPSEASTKGTGTSGALTQLHKSTLSTQEGMEAPSELVHEHLPGPASTQLSSQQSRKDNSSDYRSQEPSSQVTTQDSGTLSHSSALAHTTSTTTASTTTTTTTVGQSSSNIDSGRANP